MEHSFIHAFIHCFTIHSAYICSFINSSFTHHSFIHCLSFIQHSFAHSLTHLSFTHSFSLSFTLHTFAHSLIHLSFIIPSLSHFLVPGTPRLLPGHGARQVICLSTLSQDVKLVFPQGRIFAALWEEEREQSPLAVPGPARCSFQMCSGRTGQGGKRTQGEMMRGALKARSKMAGEC